MTEHHRNVVSKATERKMMTRLFGVCAIMWCAFFTIAYAEPLILRSLYPG